MEIMGMGKKFSTFKINMSKEKTPLRGPVIGPRKVVIFVLCGISRLFKFVLFGPEENNQVCPTIFNVITKIIFAVSSSLNWAEKR